MTALQEVAQPVIAAIIVLTISGQESVHDPANRGGLSFNQQMHMVGHQTIGIEEELEFGLLHRQ
jgi:hypothetical protein